MTYRWHVVKSTARWGRQRLQDVWDEERAAGILTAGYGNEPDGLGRRKLSRYRPGDRVLAYVPGFGAVGVGEVVGDRPEYRPVQARDDYAHWRRVVWAATVGDLEDAVPVAAIKAAGGYAPRTLAMQLDEEVGVAIEEQLVARYAGSSCPR